jgi:hypothetical protein
MLNLAPEYRQALQDEISCFEGEVQTAFNGLGILDKPTPETLFVASYKHPALPEMIDDSVQVLSANGKGKAKFKDLLNKGLALVSKAGTIAEGVRGATNPPIAPAPTPPAATPVPPVSKKTIYFIVGGVLVVMIGLLVYLKTRKK